MKTKNRIAVIAGAAALVGGSLFVGGGPASADYGGSCTETASGSNLWHCRIFTSTPEEAEREAQRARDLGGQNVSVTSPFEGGWDAYSYWEGYPRINL